ncbi:flagellar hook-associated protein FlgL [Helicobacter ailurogastricus]|uniref:Flagellar hook-associated protein FlgL n=1 Tax=Helicobacter ailurogastricus TaxID=1578720 RepID=A0A0K2Y0D7_9HELI|nr:flagellar hook-associated protein FlgL [Helicobacter ailurogastricus]CRF52368.1 Flagellar hook-associated protein FlgL [Helicobacter ailurogastricus]
MRITDSNRYNQINYYQNALQNKLNTANNQIASGLKAEYGYQNNNVNNQNLKYGFESNTLDQAHDVAQSAYTSTLNTDKALSELSSTMEQFKTKLIQAASDVHSTTSRQAIALDLAKLKDHMINVANTSIGGEYLFGGSKVDRPPFDKAGNYYGNNENLNALIGSNNLVPYNISGQNLFLGKDVDRQKIITANIKKLNQSKLHPDIMDAYNRTQNPQEVYINAQDTLRDLIGDTDNDPRNDKPEYFYLQGVRPDGSAFKAKFALDKGYNNKADATRVQDLLDQIGKAYGNTSTNQVVQVSLNAWGEIEIRDLTPGRAALDFHMLSSEKNVDDLNDLFTSGARVSTYVKSAFVANRSLESLQSTLDPYDHRMHDIKSAFITTEDNTPATRNTPLKDILGPSVASLKLEGTRPNKPDGHIDTTPLEPLILAITPTTTMQDLMDGIKSHFGGKLDVELSNDGHLRVVDNNVRNKAHDSNKPPFDGESGFSLKITSLDAKGTPTQALPLDYADTYKQTYFSRQGAYLHSNVSQIVPKSMDYATGASTLASAMGAKITQQDYTMVLKDNNGVDVKAQLHLSPGGAFLDLPKKSGGVYHIPLYNRDDTPPHLTKPNDFTYRQLMDAMTLAFNFSNSDPKEYEQAQAGAPSKASKDAFLSLLKQADERVDVNLNDRGQVQIHDKMHSKTPMQFMFYDNKASDFSPESLRRDTPAIRLNANNAPTIDTPHIHFFKQLDQVIEAVREGIDRPDSLQGYGPEMRNTGIQNGIALIDHLSDHIEKIIASNGAHSRNFSHVMRRNEVLKNQVESIRADTTGTDVAQTYNKFAQLRNNYDASLASASKINQMSLTNYL